MNNFIGWIGAILLAGCGIPEVYSAFRYGNTGLTWGLLLMWLFGEIFALIYTTNRSKSIGLRPLLFNYGVNIICILILIGYKL